jgi:hypothetical protein
LINGAATHVRVSREVLRGSLALRAWATHWARRRARHANNHSGVPSFPAAAGGETANAIFFWALARRHSTGRWTRVGSNQAS